MKQRLFFIVLFVLGLGVAIYYFSEFLRLEHPTFGRHLNESLILFVLLAIIIQLCAHYIRAYKSGLLINQIRPVKTMALFKGLSVGYLFNVLLPLRLGELVRAYYVGEYLAISKTVVLISIIIERVVDGIILGICILAAGFAFYNSSHNAYMYLTRIGLGLIILSVVIGIIINLLRKENKLILYLVRIISSLFNDRISSHMQFIAWSGIYGTKLMLAKKKVLIKYLALSLLMWGVYFISTMVVVLTYFNRLNLSKTWFVIQTTYAGASVPAGPGYIGTFQIFVSKLLGKIGLGLGGGFSLLLWFILVVPISTIGLVVLIRQRYAKKTKQNKELMLVNKLYREQNISQELTHFLESYFNGEPINQILTQAELEDKFKLIKSFRGGSHAHTMLVWQDKGKLVKKISLLQYADKLEAQADWLKERAGLPHLPTVIGQEKTDLHYYFDLTYHEDFYPFFDFIHSKTEDDSFKIMKNIITFMNKRIYKKYKVSIHKQEVKDYIDNKVLQKVTDAASMSNVLDQLLTYTKLNINGSKYTNLTHIITKIKNNKQAMKDLAKYCETPIHGDLTIDNIIVNNKLDFLILDPNNENQVSSRVVDYGKLYQSLHSGYEFLILLEKCSVKKNNIHFEDTSSHKYADLYHLLDSQLKKDLEPYEYRSILFHEAVHYCRMLTYRATINSKTLPVFYAIAVQLFNSFLKQYEANNKR